MVLSTSQGRTQLLFIAPMAKLVVTPSVGKRREHWTCPSPHQTHPVSARTVFGALNHLKTIHRRQQVSPKNTTPDSQFGHTGRVRSIQDVCAESSAKWHQHRTHTSDMSGPYRTHAQRALQTELAPDAHTRRVRSHTRRVRYYIERVRSHTGCVRSIPDGLHRTHRVHCSCVRCFA